jgi:predicted transcriptional regulator
MRRYKTVIFGLILAACKEPVNKTKILNRVELNDKMGTAYIKHLVDRGFMSSEKCRYQTTPLGADMLAKIQVASEMML